MRCWRRTVVLSAFGNHHSTGVSLLAGCSLEVDISLVFAVNRDRLVVANVAVRTHKLKPFLSGLGVDSSSSGLEYDP